MHHVSDVSSPVLHTCASHAGAALKMNMCTTILFLSSLASTALRHVSVDDFLYPGSFTVPRVFQRALPLLSQDLVFGGWISSFLVVEVWVAGGSSGTFRFFLCGDSLDFYSLSKNGIDFSWLSGDFVLRKLTNTVSLVFADCA